MIVQVGCSITSDHNCNADAVKEALAELEKLPLTEPWGTFSLLLVGMLLAPGAAGVPSLCSKLWEMTEFERRWVGTLIHGWLLSF